MGECNRGARSELEQKQKQKQKQEQEQEHMLGPAANENTK